MLFDRMIAERIGDVQGSNDIREEVALAARYALARTVGIENIPIPGAYASTISRKALQFVLARTSDVVRECGAALQIEEKLNSLVEEHNNALKRHIPLVRKRIAPAPSESNANVTVRQ